MTTQDKPGVAAAPEVRYVWWFTKRQGLVIDLSGSAPDDFQEKLELFEGMPENGYVIDGDAMIVYPGAPENCNGIVVDFDQLRQLIKLQLPGTFSLYLPDSDEDGASPVVGYEQLRDSILQWPHKPRSTQNA